MKTNGKIACRCVRIQYTAIESSRDSIMNVCLLEKIQKENKGGTTTRGICETKPGNGDLNYLFFFWRFYATCDIDVVVAGVAEDVPKKVSSTKKQT